MAKRRSATSPVAAPDGIEVHGAGASRLAEQLLENLGITGRSASTQNTLPPNLVPYLRQQLTADPSQFTDPYRQEVWVGSCVNFRARMVSSVAISWWDREATEPGAREVTTGPLVELFRKPTKGIDDALFVRFLSMFMDLAGETDLYLRDAAGRPISAVGTGPDALLETPADIVPVRGDLVELALDDQGYPGEWKTRTARGEVVYPGHAVLPLFDMPDPNPGRPWRGIGPLAQAYGPALQTFLADRFVSKLFMSGGQPGGVVTLKAQSVGGERMRLTNEFDDRWNNPADQEKRWRLLFGDAAISSTQTTPKDAQVETLRKGNKSDIAQMYGVPPALLGEHQENFATFTGHMRIFLIGTMIPLLRWIERAINMRLVARLRDGKLATQRCRFRTDLLERAFGDAMALGDQVAKLRWEAGLPLAEALAIVGLKPSTQIPGDTVAYVKAGYVPADLALLRAQADAALALQFASVDPAAALKAVGLGGMPLAPEPEPEPDPEPLPQAQPAAAGDGGRATSTPAATRDVSAVEARAQQFARPGDRVVAWRHAQAVMRPHRDKLTAAVKRTYHDMRRAQLRALDEFAATGTVDRALLAQREDGLTIRACGTDPWRVHAAERPALPPAAATALAVAYRKDIARHAAPTPPALALNDCCGHRIVSRRDDFPGLATAGWAARYPRLCSRFGIHACIDAALLATGRVQLTDAELDQLLVVAERRWSEALAKRMGTILEQAWRSAIDDLSGDLGLATLEQTPPDVLARILTRSVQVAEGATSAVAKRVRSELLEVLTREPPSSLATLQEAITNALTELKAGTTRAFNSLASRALTIARTETAIATNGARFERLVKAYLEGLIDTVRWATSGRPPDTEPGGTVRPSHYAIDGATTTPGIPFVTGAGRLLLFPGDPSGEPGEIINCECTLVPEGKKLQGGPES